jgi:TatD DNase family protein
MLIDSHCHLDHHYYEKDLNQVIERAKKANIAFILTNGIDYKTNIISLELSNKYSPIVKPILGFYPQDALDREEYFKDKNKDKKTLNDTIKLIKENKDKILAIGEIGLDLHNGKNIKQQSEDFKKLIKLAIELDKPIIVHTRKAEKEALELIKESKIHSQQVILHCFSANKELVKQAISEDYNFSIPTNITRAENFQELVKICPLNHILTETDGPYLSPFKNEDKSFNRNEPAYIKESIKKIAELKNITPKEAEDKIFENFKRIFKVL